MNGRRSLLGAGFSALSHGRLIALLALATALLGVTAAVPLWPALDAGLAGTLAGDNILRNHPTFAPTDVFDFLRVHGDAVLATRQAMFWCAVLGVLLQMAFAGGIVASLGRPGALSWSDFFGGVRRNLWHNAKCFGIFLLLAALILGVWLGGGFAALRKIFEQAPPWSSARFGSRLALGLAALLIFAVLSLLYDFARAARRSSPSIGASKAWGFARRALSGAWGRALPVFLFWAIVGGGAVLALLAFEWAGTATSWAGIAGHTLLQVAVLAARSAVRVGAWGSELALFDERAATA